MKRNTIHHYMWYAVILIAIIMGVCSSKFWWVPFVVYFVVEFVFIFIIALLKGKIKSMPKIVGKSLHIIWQKRK